MKNKTKFLFLFFAMISYTLAYMMINSGEEIKIQESTTYKQERIDYTKILIQAKSFTKITTLEPIQVTNQEKSKVFKHIFIIEEISDQFGENKKFWIDAPSQSIQEILKLKTIELHSHNITFSKKKRGKSYEINY